MIHNNRIGYLDKTRQRMGSDRFCAWFSELAASDRQTALQHLGDEKLQFPSFFLLMPTIDSLKLYEAMSPHNRIALEFCALKRNRIITKHFTKVSSKDNEAMLQMLKWIVLTGASWEAPANDREAYDAIIDTASCVLIGKYEDRTILPEVIDLLFRRERRGLLIHDLIWGFYHSFDPASYRLVAGHLLSNDPKEMALACKILHKELPEHAGKAEKQKLYNAYTAWLDENIDCLYCTGEGLQLTSFPEPLRVDAEAKYLCKKISPRDRTYIEPLTESEHLHLKQFREAASDEQEQLADYSHLLHSRSQAAWKEWMQRKMSDRLAIAKAGWGGAL